MKKLLKINKLKGFRFFQDFTSSAIADFNKINVIYGSNGCGKTTLSDFFHCIENELKGISTKSFNADEETRNTTFELTFEEAGKITRDNFANIPSIKVFHSDFAQELISKKDNLSPIFTISEEHDLVVKEIDKAKEKLHSINEKIENAKTSEDAICLSEIRTLLDKITKEFETFKSDKARNIKDAIGEMNYTKSKYGNDFEAFENYYMLTSHEYQKKHKEMKSEEKPLSSISVAHEQINITTLQEELLDILTQKPGNAAIETLKNNPLINNWAEQGLKLHDDNSSYKCYFCDNDITENRFALLKDHFDESYKKLSKDILDTINKIDGYMQIYTKKAANFPVKELLYIEFQEDYAKEKAHVENILTTYTENFAKIKNILSCKKENLTETDNTKNEEVKGILSSMRFDNNDFKNILNIAKKHDEKSDNFKAVIEKAKLEIKNHHLSDAAEQHTTFQSSINQLDTQSRDLENKLSEAKEKLQSEKKQIEQEILELETKASGHTAIAAKINKEIAAFFHRDEISLSVEENCYKITRHDGRQVQKLSRGEENALALIYFFNTFDDKDFDIKNAIVVIDDPISSFDLTFYYNAITYIKKKTKKVGQLFVLTHKFSFYKELIRIYGIKEKEEPNANLYILKRQKNAPVLVCPDVKSVLQDEYSHIFREVYAFTYNNNKEEHDIERYEWLSMANLARQILESFVTFKKPIGGKLSEKINKLIEEINTLNNASGNTMYFSLNKQCHRDWITMFEHIDISSYNFDNLKETLKDLFKFIECVDKVHFLNLTKDIPLQQSDDIQQDDNDTRSVLEFDLYDISVAAGFVAPALEDLEKTKIYVKTRIKISDKNKSKYFAVKISGDSMTTKYPDGAIVLVKPSEDIEINRVGIFYYDGNFVCKRKKEENGKYILHSDNPEHPPKTITSPDQVKTYGEVVEVVTIYERTNKIIDEAINTTLSPSK